MEQHPQLLCPKHNIQLRPGFEELLPVDHRKHRHSCPHHASQRTGQKSQLVHHRAEIHQTQLPATRKEVAHQQRDRRPYHIHDSHRLLKETKKKALANCIKASTNCSKQLFVIVEEFSNPEATKSDLNSSQELCNTLLPQKDLSHLQKLQTPTPHHQQDQPPHTYKHKPLLTHWDPLTTQATISIMNSVKSQAATDPCSHYIFKFGSKMIDEDLKKVLNTFVTSASFPQDWKHAEVRLLLKKPSSNLAEPKNYWPISLL